MKATREVLTDEALRLYTKSRIADLTGRSPRSLEEDAASPDSPLKWTHRVGKKVACDHATFMAYRDSLRVRA